MTMTSYSDLQHTEIIDGFTIKFYAEEEPCSIKEYYPEETPAELQAIYDSLDHYDTVWFLAKVTASKNNIVLATEYLGCCHYDSYEDFYVKHRNDYYIDMVYSVIAEAEKAIVSLSHRAAAKSKI